MAAERRRLAAPTSITDPANILPFDQLIHRLEIITHRLLV